MDKLQKVESNLMDKHNTRLNQLDRLENSLTNEKEKLLQERTEMLTVKQELRYKMETSVVIYRDRKRGTYNTLSSMTAARSSMTGARNNNKVSMSQGVRLNIQLYDERQRIH